jgi:hypothetical protein
MKRRLIFLLTCLLCACTPEEVIPPSLRPDHEKPEQPTPDPPTPELPATDPLHNKAVAYSVLLVLAMYYSRMCERLEA